VITRTLRDRVVVLTLHRPPVNALDLATCQDLVAHLADLDDARGVVLTGAGRVFSAGVDLGAASDGGPAYVAAYLPVLDAAFTAALACELPVVAALNGHAVGGGFVLAGAADRVVARTGPLRLGLPESALGVPLPRSGQEAVRPDPVDVLVDPDDLVDRAVAEALTLVAPGFTAAKQERRRDQLARIAAYAERERAAALPVWTERIESGALRDYLSALTRR
jgi:enoyl-CoA hydratase